MAEESSFLLVNLKDEKLKKLAQVITNETSRKILEYLTQKKDSTESDMAKELGMPISTIHYNLQHLVESGLVEIKEFHYSEKGKEMNHYTLSNKIIIIAPKTTETFLQKLKKILPVAIISTGAAGTIYFIQKYVLQPQVLQKNTDAALRMAETPTVQESAKTIAASAPGITPGPEAMLETTKIAANTSQSGLMSNAAIWFLIGAIFAIAAFLIMEKLKEKKRIG